MWRRPKVWLGVLVSLAALYLAMRGIDWALVWEALSGAHYVWLVPSAVSVVVAVWVRGERWFWLFGERRNRLPRSRYVGATAISYLVTNSFPLRLGEVARLFFIVRGRQQSYGLAASTIAVEHVLDVLVVLGMLLAIVVGGGLPLPDWARQGAVVAGAALVGVLVLILVAVRQRERVLRLTAAVASRTTHGDTRRVVSAVEHMLDGFAVLRPGLPLLMALFWSVVSWLASAVTWYLSLKAFLPDAPFTYALFTTVVTTFVMMLPATPGSLGTLQLGIQKSLAVFGVPAAVGLSFSIVSHVLGIIVMDLVGVICLVREAGSWAKAKESLVAVSAQAWTRSEAISAVDPGTG
ncbi:MAG: lysylphosphatidylglycerol synthase transmembrane domain-containing protein [Candidatus Latescibacterota bacterium]|jgi:hypothetical protein